MRRWGIPVLAVMVLLGVTSPAQAQATDRRVSVEIGIGLDNGIKGNINSSAIGELDGQTTVVLKNKYSDVYGVGVHLRFGAGYRVAEHTELRGTFTFQSADAELVPMGDFGASRLYGQYDDYRTFGLEFGARQYVDIAPEFQVYGEGAVGIAFIAETDVVLAAPGASLVGRATDFYDRTAAFTLGGNGGVLWHLSPQFGAFAQMGLRYVTGMSRVDGLAGTGLERINEHSWRLTVPVVLGVQMRF